MFVEYSTTQQRAIFEKNKYDMKWLVRHQYDVGMI